MGEGGSSTSRHLNVVVIAELIDVPLCVCVCGGGGAVMSWPRTELPKKNLDIIDYRNSEYIKLYSHSIRNKL